MSGLPLSPPPGWYRAKGDPPGTQRYWDGTSWQSGPVPIPGLASNEAGRDLAALPARVAARAIDLIVWVTVSVVVGLIGGGLSISGADDGRSRLGAVLVILAIVAYETLMVGLRGATIGKLVVGAEVQRVDGSSADLVAAARRVAPLVVLGAMWLVPGLAWVVNVVALLLAAVGLVMIDTDGRAQAPWDKLARTLVAEDQANGGR